MNKNILVIAAHPDDEILGCGGTMARHIDRGDSVKVLIMCEGVTSRKIKELCKEDHQEMDMLYQAARKASIVIGYHKLEIRKLPDNRLDSIQLLDIVKIIEEKIESWNIDVVYTHSPADVNIDHQIIYEATITACRPMPNSRVKQILCYEVASSTEWRPANGVSGAQFNPNLYVNIEKYWGKKIKALKCYRQEMKEWPHPRSIKGVEIMAQNRGIQIGRTMAEAFFIAREIYD